MHILCTGKGLGYYISENRVLKWVLRQTQKLDKKIEASLVPAKPSKANSDSDFDSDSQKGVGNKGALTCLRSFCKSGDNTGDPLLSTSLAHNRHAMK
jgi:hypothetical protein